LVNLELIFFLTKMLGRLYRSPYFDIRIKLQVKLFHWSEVYT